MIESKSIQCRWCGMIHGPRCSIVKAMEFHPDGTVRHVEFFGPNDYPAPKLSAGPNPTSAQLSRAAHRWISQKDREYSIDDERYFRSVWSELPGLRRYVEEECARGD